MLKLLPRCRGVRLLQRNFTIPVDSIGDKDPNEPKHPEEPIPGLCCGQGCGNCVWIVYAHELVDFYHGKHKDRIIKEIESKVEDPNVRAFVVSEIKSAWRHPTS